MLGWFGKKNRADTAGSKPEGDVDPGPTNPVAATVPEELFQKAQLHALTSDAFNSRSIDSGENINELLVDMRDFLGAPLTLRREVINSLARVTAGYAPFVPEGKHGYLSGSVKDYALILIAQSPELLRVFDNLDQDLLGNEGCRAVLYGLFKEYYWRYESFCYCAWLLQDFKLYPTHWWWQKYIHLCYFEAEAEIWRALDLPYPGHEDPTLVQVMLSHIAKVRSLVLSGDNDPIENVSSR